MKISYKIAAVALMLGFAVQANAQNNDDATASATIVAPITLTNTAGISFGSVAPNGVTASSVVLATNGGLSSSDGAQIIGTTGTAAAFDVTGDDLAYSIVVPTTAVTLTESVSSATMTIDNFTDSKSGSSTIAGGVDNFTVGATLNLGITQTEGLYEGTFNVSVNYN